MADWKVIGMGDLDMPETSRRSFDAAMGYADGYADCFIRENFPNDRVEKRWGPPIAEKLDVWVLKIQPPGQDGMRPVAKIWTAYPLTL